MDNSLLIALEAAQSLYEKAAIIAEFVFEGLPPTVAHVARQCIILHWFDRSIIEAFLHDASFSEAEINAVLQQLTSLSFIEETAWGLTFQSVTREGLLQRYIYTNPELLQAAASLAAPVYKSHMEDAMSAAEALFCSIVSNDLNASKALLDMLLEKEGDNENLQDIETFFRLQDEAERLPIVLSVPPTENTYLFHGLVHRVQGNSPAAIADYSRAIELNPGSSLAFIGRGNVYVEQQQYEKALADYKLSLSIDSTLIDAYINQGIIYKRLERYDEAIAAFEQALVLEPDHIEALKGKNEALDGLKRNKAALATFQRAFQSDPDKTNIPHTRRDQKKRESFWGSRNWLISDVRPSTWRGENYRRSSLFAPSMEVRDVRPSTTSHRLTIVNSLAGTLAVALILIGIGTFYVIHNDRIAQQHIQQTVTATGNTLSTQTAVALAIAATSNESANATATSMATSPYLPFNTMAFYDPLMTNTSSLWTSNSRCVFTGTGYQVSSQAGYSQFCLNSKKFGEFAYQVSVVIQQGDCGGLVFRYVDASNFYFFKVCQNGTYNIGNDINGRINTFYSNFQSSLAIEQGKNQKNVIAVTVQGTIVKMYVNGENINTVTSEPLTSSLFKQGQIGLLAASNSNLTSVVYTNAYVWTTS